jgi:formylglycine-generating enzyme required for sulfatase activity
MTRRAITSRQVLPAACCALALWLAAPAPALAQAAPTGADTAAVPAGLPLAEQARTLLAQGRTAQALTVARRAVEQQPGDYKGHYYLAFALMELGESDAAVRAVQQAAARAGSAAAKEAVAALQAQIQARDGLKEADSALADGLHAKAARLYLEIWKRGGLPPDKTLAAADLLQRQLKDLPNAVAMLRELSTRALGSPAGEEAAKRLVALKPELERLSAEAVQQAQALEPGSPERARWLRHALEAQAQNQDAQLLQINDAAETQDWAALEPLLKRAQRQGQLQGLLEARRLALGHWQQHAGLQTLLGDIWGAQRAGELLQLNTERQGSVAPERLARQRQVAAARAAEAFQREGLVAGTGAAFKDCDVCPAMVWLPAGPMPQRPGNDPLVQWLNKVRFVAPFAMGKFEITFDEWDACAAQGPCRRDVPEGSTEGLLFDTHWGRGRQPVVNISLRDARTYAQWLSARTGHSYRVMSLAEYFYAVRSGSPTPLPTQQANCQDCVVVQESPLPVGSLPANAWGLHDLVGNVWEMLEGCYSVRTNADQWPTDGQPITAACATGEANLVRHYGGPTMLLGGSWADSRGGPHAVPSTTSYEGLEHPHHGFRLVRAYQPR